MLLHQREVLWYIRHKLGIAFTPGSAFQRLGIQTLNPVTKSIFTLKDYINSSNIGAENPPRSGWEVDLLSRSHFFAKQKRGLLSTLLVK